MTFYSPEYWVYDDFRIEFDARGRAYLKESREPDPNGDVQREFLLLMTPDEVRDTYGNPYPKKLKYEHFDVVFNREGHAFRRQVSAPSDGDGDERLDYLTPQQVRERFGEPVSAVYPDKSHLQMWEYTQPGHLGRWADVTWDVRRVLVDMERYRVLEVHAFHIRAGDPVDRPGDLNKVLRGAP